MRTDPDIVRLAAANPFPPTATVAGPTRGFRPRRRILIAAVAATVIIVPTIAVGADLGSLFGFSTQGQPIATTDTPFSRVHLENMLRAQSAGAEIFPIIPSFYHGPKHIDDLVDQFCCRVLAHLDLEQPQQFHWKGEKK